MVSFVCPHCEAFDIVKRGKRHNKSGIKQLYRCNHCHSIFVEPNGFARMRFKKEKIVRAIHMHEDGLSLSKVQNQLWQHDNIKVSRETINNWTTKFSVFLKSTSPTIKTKN